MFKRLSFILLLLFLNLGFNTPLLVAASCTPPSLIPPDNVCSVGGDVTITATVPDSTATLSGFAPTSSIVSFKDNGANAGTTITNGLGLFNKTIVSTPGVHDFTVWLTDTSGRTTPDTTISGVNLPFHVDTTVTNIHLPPTIAVSKTSLTSGETISIFGQAAPGSTIHVIINGVEKFAGVISGSSDWNFNTNNAYSPGNNHVYAFLTRGGATDSVNSHSLNFNVTDCRRSDFNCDGHVDLTDFSILLYHWETSNSGTDTNGDGTTGLIDFSIMLFDWTD